MGKTIKLPPFMAIPFILVVGSLGYVANVLFAALLLLASPLLFFYEKYQCYRAWECWGRFGKDLFIIVCDSPHCRARLDVMLPEIAARSVLIDFDQAIGKDQPQLVQWLVEHFRPHSTIGGDLDLKRVRSETPILVQFSGPFSTRSFSFSPFKKHREVSPEEILDELRQRPD
jgi:hypothetical protein